MTKNIPTPTPTVTIRTVLFITALTCPARTERSGSATVISKPIRKHTDMRISNFFDLVSPEPTCSPIGVIARSAPRLKRPMPIMSITADTAKAAVSVPFKSISGVKDIISTINATGKTEIDDSLSLSNRAFIKS